MIEPRSPRRVLSSGVAVAVAIAASGAGAQPAGDRSVAAPDVTALSATGSPARIAFLEHGARESCGVVRAWLLSPRLIRRLSRPCRARSWLYGLASGQEQLAWASVDSRKREVLWVADYDPIEDRYSSQRVVARAGARTAPLIVADGGGLAVAYAVGRRVTWLVSDGTIDRRTSWKLPSRPVRLATDGPYVATQESNGNVSVFLEGSAPNDPVPAAHFKYPRGQIDAIKLDQQRLLLLRGSTLEVRLIYGRSSRTFTLPGASSYGDDHCGRPTCPTAGLRVADLDGNLVVYLDRSTLHVLRVTDGRDITLRSHLAGAARAELQPTGLSYSTSGRVFFIPRKTITHALAG